MPVLFQKIEVIIIKFIWIFLQNRNENGGNKIFVVKIKQLRRIASIIYLIKTNLFWMLWEEQSESTLYT